MPLKNGHLTAGEKAIAAAYADTENKAFAAFKAGMSPISGNVDRALARPAVQAEIVRRQMERLASDALPIAVNTLISILQDVKAPAGARVSAAKVVLDRTLGTDDAGRRKDPADMSPAELAEAIEQLKRVASERAKPVLDLEPNDQAQSTIFD